MRVIHSLSWYLPESSGGTETYVADLIRSLRSSGIENRVVAAKEGYEPESYIHDNVDVFRYPVEPDPSIDQIRGFSPHGGFDHFRNWLSNQRADVYHQHSLIGGCGLHHLRVARELGFKTVLTVHLASAICLRGTMMLRGEGPCDGEVQLARCGVCWGMSRGISSTIAPFIARVPFAVSNSFSRTDSPLASAIATRAMVREHLVRLKQMSEMSDRVIAISEWLYQALRLNGFSRNKLVLCHTGGPKSRKRELQRTQNSDTLRVGYFGRWDKLKGVDLLVRAIKKLPANSKVELTIHGLPGNEQEENYQRLVEIEAGSDPRIVFARSVSKENLPTTLAAFDAIAIPSQLLETGPLIALEAHAAGVPIIASDLGGLSERVRDGVDGLLVPAADEDAWTSAVQRLAKDRGLLDRLRNGISSVRTMDDVATDMSGLYRDLLGASSTVNAA